MIYTAISRIPFLASDNGSSKMFKVFLMGSVLYVILHYYLFSASRGAMLDKFKSYLYYGMAADFAVAYIWATMFRAETDKNTEDDKKFSESERQAIMRNLQMRHQQLLLEQQKTKHSPFLKKEQNNAQQPSKDENANKEHKNEKEESSKKESPKKHVDKSKTTSSSSSPPPSKNKKNKHKKDLDDTDIPIFIDKDDE